MDPSAAAKSPASGPRGTLRLVRWVRERREQGRKARPAAAVTRPPRGVELCLSIGPSGVGLALAAPVALGPLSVRELEVALPGMSFPLDVSGGVHRFRHRRGELRKLTLVGDLGVIATATAPALRELIGAGVPDVRLAAADGRVRVTVSPAPASREHPDRVLVFEVACRIEDDAVELVATDARGASLPAPAQRLAGEALARALGKPFGRAGSTFTLRGVAARVAATLLPEAGARAPRPSTMGAAALAFEGLQFTLSIRPGRGFVGDEAGFRAAEGARLAEPSDARVARGELDLGRTALLEALATAPRHTGLLRRLIELDALGDGRADAALATLRELDETASPHLGDLPARLLAGRGRQEAARARAVRDAEREPDATLRAALRVQAAELAPGTLSSLSHLDEATCDAPDRAYVRRARLACALAAGMPREAEADAAFLEAMIRGAAAKCATLVDVGAAFAAHGHPREAAALFEGALRFVPDEPTALAGLGSALAKTGDAARAATLLARAARVAPSPREEAKAGLALARLLEVSLRDLSAAAARAAAIPSDTPEAGLGRLVEARCRAALGDAAGASLALGAFRDHIEAIAGDELLPAVMEAIRLEADVLRSPVAALRTLELGLSLLPSSPELLAERRALVRESAPPDAYDDDSCRPKPTVLGAHSANAEVDSAPATRASFESAPDDHALDARVEVLIDRLRADPTQDAVVDELVELLTMLGRSLELLALLSARLDDAPEGRRPALLTHQRAVLARLEREAHDAGRQEEASLFAMSRDALA